MQNPTRYNTTSISEKNCCHKHIEKDINLVSCQYWLPFKPLQAVLKNSKSRNAFLGPVLNNLQTEKKFNGVHKIK